VIGDTVESLSDLVSRAQRGDLDAFERLVRRTQAMAYSVARGVVRDAAKAEDAAQDAYLRAFRRLSDLDEPGGFVPWFRRIVITVALNLRRRDRATLLCLDDLPDVPVLDEAETRWTSQQRRHLAGALLTLSPDERQLCDRRYHGGWSTARLAESASIGEQAMRKRLQRVRDKLRKEIEVAEQRSVRPEDIHSEFPGKIIELLARPKLTDLPENPVGRTLDQLRATYAGYVDIDLPEIVDLSEAQRTIADDAMYVAPDELHRIDANRVLRYDLTLPLLLTVRFEGRPLRLFSSGKAYRSCETDATHLEAFHQAEVLCLDERARVDPWHITGQVLQSVHAILPGRAVKIVPTGYAMCSQAWELEVEDDGRWSEVLAWGVFTDRVVRHMGADPATHSAVGVGYGIERLAMLRYGIDDIRKVDIASVA
jgi:RNA polymerase sigma-70 factor (ECF subfamily)